MHLASGARGDKDSAVVSTRQDCNLLASSRGLLDGSVMFDKVRIPTNTCSCSLLLLHTCMCKIWARREIARLEPRHSENCLVTLGASFGGAKFEVQNAKFEVQNAKFEVQNTKFEVQNVVPVFEFQRSSREIF